MNETDIANLQSALIAAGHTGDCPVVHAASVDCVPGGECVDWRSRAEKAEVEAERLREVLENIAHAPPPAGPPGYDDRLQELRDAIAWNQRQGIGHVVLKTELVEGVIAEVERLHSQVDSDFVRNYGLNKGIENAVDAFVKAAAERDGWKKAALRLKDAARLLRKSGLSDLQRVRELEAERDRWEDSAQVRAELLAEARVERDKELACGDRWRQLAAQYKVERKRRRDLRRGH